MSRNLDETVRLQSEKREEWIREIFFNLAYLSSSYGKAMHCYVLDGKPALALELLFPGHLSST